MHLVKRELENNEQAGNIRKVAMTHEMWWYGTLKVDHKIKDEMPSHAHPWSKDIHF